MFNVFGLDTLSCGNEPAEHDKYNAETAVLNGAWVISDMSVEVNY